MNNFSNTPQQGWICPRCGKVNAPWMPNCDCNLNTIKTPTSPSTGTPYYEEPRVVCQTSTSQFNDTNTKMYE